MHTMINMYRIVINLMLAYHNLILEQEKPRFIEQSLQERNKAPLHTSSSRIQRF